MDISERYKIIQNLGNQRRRKFGAIFLVEDLKSGLRCVMKVVEKNKATTTAMQRLFSEATFSFATDNLPTVLDFQETDTNLILVREYVSGNSLDAHCSQLKRRQKHSFLSDVLRQLEPILRELHEQAIYHCDVKPSNLIIDDKGAVHLIDFGLALRKPISERRELLFPLGYAAPELLLNRLDLVDHRTDYFAVGVMLWRLYSRKLPLTHPNPSIFTNLQLTHPLPESPEIPKKIQRLLEKLCVKHSFKKPPNTMKSEEVDMLLQKAMQQRYAQFSEFVTAFQNARSKSWFTS